MRSILHRPDLTRRVGLGDAVAAVATPVAKALGLDCIDPASGTLKPTSPCTQRIQALNDAVPNVNPFTAPGAPPPPKQT